MFRHTLIAVHYVPNVRRPCANCLEYKLDKYASVYGHRDIEVQWLWVREWRTTRKRARFNGQKGLKWILTLPPTKISLMSTTESLPDRVASKTLRYAVSNVHRMSCWQHYRKICDSKESIPDPMAGRGTFTIEKSLLPLQPHELKTFDLVVKQFWTSDWSSTYSNLTRKDF